MGISTYLICSLVLAFIIMLGFFSLFSKQIIRAIYLLSRIIFVLNMVGLFVYGFIDLLSNILEIIALINSFFLPDYSFCDSPECDSLDDTSDDKTSSSLNRRKLLWWVGGIVLGATIAVIIYLAMGQGQTGGGASSSIHSLQSPTSVDVMETTTSVIPATEATTPIMPVTGQSDLSAEAVRLINNYPESNQFCELMTQPELTDLLMAVLNNPNAVSGLATLFAAGTISVQFLSALSANPANRWVLEACVDPGVNHKFFGVLLNPDLGGLFCDLMLSPTVSSALGNLLSDVGCRHMFFHGQSMDKFENMLRVLAGPQGVRNVEMLEYAFRSVMRRV